MCTICYLNLLESSCRTTSFIGELCKLNFNFSSRARRQAVECLKSQAMNSFLFICKILVKVLVFISRQEMFNLPRSVYCMLTHPHQLYRSVCLSQQICKRGNANEGEPAVHRSRLRWKRAETEAVIVGSDTKIIEKLKGT